MEIELSTRSRDKILLPLLLYRSNTESDGARQCVLMIERNLAD